MDDRLSRRNFLRIAVVGAAGLATTGFSQVPTPGTTPRSGHARQGDHGLPSAKHEGLIMPGTNGDVDHAANGFNPSSILTHFDYGRVSKLPGGRTLREYSVVAGVK